MATAYEGLKISLESIGLTLSDTMPTTMSNDKERSSVRNCAPESLQKSFVYVRDNNDEDGESIVVLGNSSLEAIQSDSLASFEQIQLKSMAMDCQSIISSLKPNEVEDKLTELLRENLKLKETLKQNSLTMKQHLTYLVNRQEELSKVHDAHRQKFTQTKELVNQLKLENNELKVKLRTKEDKIDSKQSHDRSTQTEMEKAIVEPKIEMPSIDNKFAAEMLKLAEKCEEQAKEIARLENVVSALNRESEANRQNTETNKAIVEPEVATPSTDNKFAAEMVKLTEKFEEQTEEIARLENVVSALNRQLESNHQNFFTGIKLGNCPSTIESSDDPHCRQFIESFTHYNDKLQALGKYYDGQATRCANVKKSLKRCNEILSDEKLFETTTNETQKSIESSIRKELQYHRNLIMDEELKITLERQEMIKAQNDFQMMFIHYNSTLLELDNQRQENQILKSLPRDEVSRQEDLTLIEARASLMKTEKLIEQQKREIENERSELATFKREIENEKIRLENEERKFIEENASINDEIIGLKETVDLLQRQCRIYEEDFADERKLRENLIAEKDSLLADFARLQVERRE